MSPRRNTMAHETDERSYVACNYSGRLTWRDWIYLPRALWLVACNLMSEQ